jgi:hypothetical protein
MPSDMQADDCDSGNLRKGHHHQQQLSKACSLLQITHV